MLAHEQNAAERSFYRHLIQPGDLVFDIGANVGAKTEIFLSLGAYVVAVEPNALCALRIRQRHQTALLDKRLRVEECAIAAERKKVTMKVFAEHGAMTSGSEAFVRTVEADGGRSTSAFESDAITANDLVTRFGLPVFMKIDVEGMDAEVLRGLDSRPRFASFEFNTALPLWPSAELCLAEAERLGFSRANFTASGTPKFILKEWCDLRLVLETIARWAKGRHTYGDVVLK
jgi:FkbM family methyltransferase